MTYSLLSYLFIASPFIIIKLFQTIYYNNNNNNVSNNNISIDLIREFNIDYILYEYIFLIFWFYIIIFKMKRVLPLMLALIFAMIIYKIEVLDWHKDYVTIGSLQGNNETKQVLKREYYFKRTFDPSTTTITTNSISLITMHSNNSTLDENGEYNYFDFNNEFVVLKHLCDFSLVISYSLIFYTYQFFIFQSWRPSKNPITSKKLRKWNDMIYLSFIIFLSLVFIALLSSFTNISKVSTFTVRHTSYSSQLVREQIMIAGYILLTFISYLRDDLYLVPFCFIIGCFQSFALFFPLYIAYIRPFNALGFAYEILFYSNFTVPYLCIIFTEILPIIGVRIQVNGNEEDVLHIWSRLNFYYLPFSGLSRLSLKMFGFNPFKVSALADAHYYTREKDKELVGDFSDIYACAAALDKATNNNKSYEPFGLFVMRLVHIWRPLSVRRKVLDYAFQHLDEIRKVEFRKPIVITGFPRSGTSLLQDLFAQDPYARTFLGWEYQIPTPPVLRENYHTDFRVIRYQIDLLFSNILELGFMKRLNQSHVVSATTYEEESLALIQAQVYVVLGVLLDDNVFETAHSEEGKRHAYEYVKILLQIISSKFGPKELHPEFGHFVMKSPLHSIFPKLIFDVFPDARVIVAHRDPFEVVGSWTKLTASCGAHYPNVDSEYFDTKKHTLEFGRRSLQQISLMADRLHKFRVENPEISAKRITDVSFRHLIKNPIGTVKQLYADLGYEYTQEFENNMKIYLEKEKNKKEGKEEDGLFGLFGFFNGNHTGKPIFNTEKDFGITKEKVHMQMKNYYEEYSELIDPPLNIKKPRRTLD